MKVFILTVLAIFFMCVGVMIDALTIELLAVYGVIALFVSEIIDYFRDKDRYPSCGVAKIKEDARVVPRGSVDGPYYFSWPKDLNRLGIEDDKLFHVVKNDHLPDYYNCYATTPFRITLITHKDNLIFVERRKHRGMS